MASGLGELFIELGTIGDIKELEKFVKKVREGAEAIEKQMKAQDKQTNSLKKTVKGFTAVVGAITAAAYALNRLTNDLVRNNQAILNLTRQSDIALSSFQKWDGIGKMFGIENAAGQLENLNEKLFELRLTGEGARGFQLAGINPIGQDAQGVLEQLRNRIQGMDNTTASYLLKQMGLDPRMITLLRMSRQEFEELGATIRKYQLTDKQRQQIEKMNIQLQIASQKLQYLKDRAILKLIPILVRLMESVAKVAEMFAKFANWLTSGTVKSRAFILSIVGITARFKGLQKILLGIGEGLSGAITKLPIIGKLFQGLGRIVSRALIPFLALWYVLDDLATYFEGGDSLIGRVLDWGAEKGQEIGDAFKRMFGGDFIGGSAQLSNTVEEILNNIYDVLVNLSEIVLNFFTVGLYDSLKKWTNGTITKEIKAPFQIMFGDIPGAWQSLTGSLTGGAAMALTNEELGQILAEPAMTQSIDNSNAISNANTTISMTNYIETEQPAQTIDKELRFTMAANYA